MLKIIDNNINILYYFLCKIEFFKYLIYIYFQIIENIKIMYF